MSLFQKLKDSSQSDLVDALNQDDLRHRDKVLVLDSDIIGPLGLVAQESVLQENGVKQLIRLSSHPFETEHDTIIYIVQPRIHYMKWISDQIKTFLSQSQSMGTSKNAPPKRRKFVLYLTPRKTLICEKVLKETGISIPDDLILRELPVDLFCFDVDLLSMELPAAFRECTLDGDLSSLYYIAKAIMKLQSMYGLIPHVKAKGDMSTSVAKMMLRMQRQMSATHTHQNTLFNHSPSIHQLLLIDRSIDLVSPLLTQHTYEGLIDEFFGIQNGIFTATFEPCIPGGKIGQRVALNSTDSIFRDTRDLYWGFVGKSLNAAALDVKARESRRNDLQSVKDIREFTLLLPQLKMDKRNLEMHINIMQQIKALTGRRDFRKTIESEQAVIGGSKLDDTFKYIEECINKKDQFTKVLRLLMLISIVNNGIPVKKFAFFRNEILQTYGFETMLSLNNLEKLNVLCRKSKSINYPWKTLASLLNIVDPEQEDMLDIHHVYGGVAPMSIELVRRIAQSEWDDNLETLLQKLPGRHLRYTQQNTSYIPSMQQRKTVLVFMIGGVTMAEISALRYLNKQQDKYEYKIATTKLINGSTFVQPLLEELSSLLRRGGDMGISKKTEL
uniref:Sec1-like protein n=1 Tax=Percolomonas cosmopolitus TaxID=63605 RepID=A0A7S1KPA5_9EUKA|mmetsp:Transcript_2746/g.10577  ORF Transcript_2746/g.10577 Transcript_2746/m.10577 type:complete len:613 (+) Transcript_2746:2-1840(+)